MQYYPIIIPTLCRFDKFRDCIVSLSENELADKTDLIIGLDFPPADKFKEGYEKIKKYIGQIHGFKKVVPFFHTRNLGSSGNSSFLQKYANENYGGFIYTEDDNIFSPYFLKFINEGLEKYENDDSVYAVCGYSYPVDWDRSTDCIMEGRYFSAWGYGTLEKKYKMAIKEISESKYSSREEILHDWKIFKNSYKNKVVSSCYWFSSEKNYTDVSYSVNLIRKNKKVIMPVLSLVRNNGWDGSGEHCNDNTSNNFFNQQILNTKKIDINSIHEVSRGEYEILEQFQISIDQSFYKEKRKALLKYLLVFIFGYNFTKAIWKLVKDAGK